MTRRRSAAPPATTAPIALTRDCTDTGVTWNTYDGTQRLDHGRRRLQRHRRWPVRQAGGRRRLVRLRRDQPRAAVDRHARLATTAGSSSARTRTCTTRTTSTSPTTPPTRRCGPSWSSATMTGFTVSTTASPTAGGTVTGGGNFQSGQTCTLTAYPDDLVRLRLRSAGAAGRSMARPPTRSPSPSPAT